MNDPRSINGLDIAERFANGMASEDERAAACAAARAAAWDAAGDAAEASNEIQGANILRRDGKPFFFLPLYGFATPEDIPARPANYGVVE